MPPSFEMQQRIVQAANHATDDECSVMILALELAWAKKHRQTLTRDTTTVHQAVCDIEKKFDEAVRKVVG